MGFILPENNFGGFAAGPIAVFAIPVLKLA
jgi:hypothetical protein